MRSLVLAAIVLLASSFSVRQLAAREGALPCPFGSGFGSKYLVPNAVAAKAIYRAVAPGILKKFPIIVVEDKGDHWEVGQTDNAPPPKVGPNEVIVSAGGGQFYMSINKCTGAITDAALNR